MFYSKLAAMVARIALATFVDDPNVTWTVTGPPVTFDPTTSVIVVSAAPSRDVGCPNARFVFDTREEVFLGLYCNGKLHAR